MEHVRILLCEGEPVVRLGLKSLLDAHDGITIVGEVSGHDGAARASAELSPDVVLMDLSVPRLDDDAAAERVRAAVQHARVLALSTIEDRWYVQSLLRAGASGYVLMRSAKDELERAVMAVAGGHSFVDPALAIDAPASEPPRSARHDLSERETEVLRLVAEGHVMKEIASKLGLSVRTLETYKARAMAKLGIGSRVEIVRYALQRGWLRPD